MLVKGYYGLAKQGLAMGIMSAPEINHAIAAVVAEARRAKEE